MYTITPRYKQAAKAVAWDRPVAAHSLATGRVFSRLICWLLHMAAWPSKTVVCEHFTVRGEACQASPVHMSRLSPNCLLCIPTACWAGLYGQVWIVSGTGAALVAAEAAWLVWQCRQEAEEGASLTPTRAGSLQEPLVRPGEEVV